MSTKHYVHEVTAPGLDGNGISAPDALAIRSDLNTLLARSIPIPFDGMNQTKSDTTSITAFTFLSCGSVVVPAGTYRVHGTATALVHRSVAGNVAVRARVGGVETTIVIPGITDIWARRTIVAALGGISVVSNGVTPIVFDVGYRGHAEAGGTLCSHVTISGTLTRIG